MTMRKTFEVEKNGYRMFMIEDSESNYKSLEIKKDNDDLPDLYIKPEQPSRMYNLLKNNCLEELEIAIGTRSIGSKSIERIKSMIAQYEQAIESAEYFKSELIKYK